MCCWVDDGEPHLCDHVILWCRDLKPENLLLTSPSDDADIKIVDFGFAIGVDGLNCTSQVGTPGYIAPEILNKVRGGSGMCIAKGTVAPNESTVFCVCRVWVWVFRCRTVGLRTCGRSA